MALQVPKDEATWIIQRCTQEWRGTELLYVDFPTPEGIMTREQMVEVLERVGQAHPEDEFRGHNLIQYGRSIDHPGGR